MESKDNVSLWYRKTEWLSHKIKCTYYPAFQRHYEIFKYIYIWHSWFSLCLSNILCRMWFRLLQKVLRAIWHTDYFGFNIKTLMIFWNFEPFTILELPYICVSLFLYLHCIQFFFFWSIFGLHMPLFMKYLYAFSTTLVKDMIILNQSKITYLSDYQAKVNDKL